MGPTDPGLRQQIERLEAKLDSDPQWALDTGQGLLAQAKHDPGLSARIEHVVGVAARAVDQIELSISYLEQALTHARQAGDDDVATGALTSLAASRAYCGDMRGALKDLEDAIETLSGIDKARAQMQRAGLLSRSGDHLASIEATDSALPSLIQANDNVWLGHAYTNRAIALATTHQVARAYDDIELAAEYYRRADHAFGVAAAFENRGFIAARAGDVMTAILSLEEAQSAYEKLGVSLGPLMKTRAELALLAGMPNEAYRLATRQLELLEVGRVEIERPLALQVSARAALLDRRFPEAAAAAREAADLFERQGRPAWRDRARFIEALASLRSGKTELGLNPHTLAQRLDDYGLGFESNQLLMEYALAEGADEGALRAGLAAVGAEAESPRVDLALQGWHARALLAEMNDSLPEAEAAVDQGLEAFRTHQLSLGATELRLRATTHARDLADRGVAYALRSNNARQVAEAIERQRVLGSDAFTITPGDQQAARLAEIEMMAREAEDDEGLAAAAGQLASWKAGPLRTPPPLGFDHLDREIAAGTLTDFVTFTFLGRDLVGASLTEHGSHMVVLDRARALAASATIRTHVQSVARGESAAETALSKQLAEYGDALRGLLANPGGRVVICPPPLLAAVPWGVLPELRDSAVSVTPSFSTWLSRNRAEVVRSGRLLACGPGLTHGEEEVRQLERDGDIVLVRSDATRSAILELCSGTRVTHLAAHGHISEENAFASKLDVADGPLHIVDFERVAGMPSIVVLSACDLGVAERTAPALIGFASALL
ncbi:MAG: hypothetical protein QNJ77_15205, partial [Acidimicrobiia bacterium]|nr:hypothetical protein [Acidimicrobiia bacterium]